MSWYAITSICITAVGLGGCIAFIVDYNRLSQGRWRDNEWGWFLMLYPAAFGSVFAFVLFSRVFGDSVYRRIAGIVLYAGLVCTLPWLHRLMRISMAQSNGMSHQGKESAMGGKIKFWLPMIGAIVMALLVTIQDAVMDRHIDAQEWVQVAIQLVMAINVWLTANLPDYERMKTWVAAVIVTLQALYTFVIGGVDSPEIINLAITFLTALGVAATSQRLTVTTTDNRHTVAP